VRHGMAQLDRVVKVPIRGGEVPTWHDRVVEKPTLWRTGLGEG
jgi:hypothetical protein